MIYHLFEIAFEIISNLKWDKNSKLGLEYFFAITLLIDRTQISFLMIKAFSHSNQLKTLNFKILEGFGIWNNRVMALGTAETIIINAENESEKSPLIESFFCIFHLLYVL